MKLDPYLTFAGNGSEAVEFYKKIFQVEPETVSRFKDTPAEAGLPVSGPAGERIMHASFKIGNDRLMLSDAPENLDQTVIAGTSTQISIHPDNRAEADRIFSALSDGGEVVMPMADAFWGDYFGMVKDKFGIRWMVNYHE